MIDKKHVYFRFFEEFRQSPTILFWGSSEGLMHLASILKDLADGGVTKTCLNDLPCLIGTHETRILVEVVQQAPGIRRRKGGGDRDFQWKLTKADAERFANMIEGLTTSKSSGHQYLESLPNEEFTVIVSKDEYDGLEDQSN